MTKRQQQPLKIFLYSVIIALMGFFIYTSGSCKSNTTPEITEASITITNKCGIQVDIFINDVWKVTMVHLQSSTLSIPELGVYEFEARKAGTDTVVASDTANINAYSNYTWTVMTSASISITNNYGESIDVYGDGTYQGTIEDQQSASIDRIPYGQHLMEATKQGDANIIASITLDITENKTYTWTVTK